MGKRDGLLFVLSDLEQGFPGGLAVKNLPVMQKTQVHFLGREDPVEEGMAPIPVFLPGEAHGQRSWRATVYRVAVSLS